jgi:hypothetical protein
MIKLLLNTRRTITRSCSHFNRLLSSTIHTYSDGFFLLIPLNTLGDKTPIWLFICYNGGKIISFYKFVGKAPYKNYNKFINKTLSENSNPAVESKKIWVPKNFISKKTQEIWSYQNIEFISYSNYEKNIPDLLRIIRSKIKNIHKSNIFNDDLKKIVNSVNTMISPLTVLNSIKVGLSSLSPKVFKRMYSSIDIKNKIRKFKESHSQGDVYKDRPDLDEKLLSLEEGCYDYLENRYKAVDNIDENSWFNSDPYKYRSLGVLGKAQDIKKSLNVVIKSFESAPYSMLFIISTNTGLKLLDKQFLVNKDTDIDNILTRIYERVDILSLKNYGITINDLVSCKFRRLRIKTLVRDHFKLNEMETLNLESKSSLTKVNSIFLHPKFVPYSMDLSKYGKEVLNDPTKNVVTYDYNGRLLRVTIHEEMRSHSIQVLNKYHQVSCEIEDENYDDYFIRSISSGSNPTFLKISHDSKLLNKEYEVETSFLKPIPKAKKHNLRILTFDIETYLKGDCSTPYACGFYDGKKSYKFYLTKYNNSEEMLLDCINSMLDPKYYGYTVYIHNLSKFDVYFIHRLLHVNFTVTGIISIDKDIISFTVNGEKSKLVFRDSITLLPDTLKNLGKSFKVKVTKGIFPYLFVNKDNLEYKDELPPYSYYNQDIETENTYKKLLAKNKVWDLKNETLKYLEKDLISLYQIMTKMSNEIWGLYSINITKYSTISSLGLAIYLSNFIPKDCEISRARGELEYAIREAYYGGAVDVIKPICVNGFYYDRNGLYAEAMLRPLPVGKPVHSLNRNLNEIFGFVKATITTPDRNHKPILPVKITGVDGDRLIFPNGTWTGWYFSEELKDAVNNHDYKVEVHESYIYKRGYNLFKGYVDKIGKIKQSSTGARRHIHKLLLNCLYGRMGMNSYRDLVKVFTPEQVQSIMLTHQVVENFSLSDSKEYIRYKCRPDRELCAVSGENYEELLMKCDQNYSNVDSSPAIAAAVTSYGRIIMNPLKFIEGNEFFYGDTDSAVLAKPLPSNLVGKKIGQFKLEYPLIKKGYFISPKLYILELENGDFVSKSKGYSGKLDTLDYLELYKGGVIKSMNKRWKRILKLDTVKIFDQTIRISSNFNKRNKLYSLGKWVDTSPLCVNKHLQITPLNLIIHTKKYEVINLSPSHDQSVISPSLPSSPSLPGIIYVQPSLPSIIYAPGPYIKLLATPTILLCLPASIQRLCLPAPTPILCLPAPIQRLCLAAPIAILYLPAPKEYLMLAYPKESLILPMADQTVIYLPAPLPSIIYIPPSLPSIVYASGPRIYLPSPPIFIALPLPSNYLALPEPTCSQFIIYLPGPIDPWHSWY